MTPMLALRALLLTAVLASCGTSTDDPAAGTTSTLSDPTVDPWAGQQTGASARYDLAAADWHATPFPTNTRMAADGKLDLSGFPAPKSGDHPDILINYLDYANAHLHGWSIQPTIYVQFDQPLDGAAFGPPTVQPTANDLMFLMDVTPESPEYGTLIPLTARMSGPGRGQYLAPNLLMAQPIWGRPLLPKTTYAFVVRRGLKDKAGLPLGRPAMLGAVIDAKFLDKTELVSTPALEKLSASLKPLFDAMYAGKIALPPKDIAAATVFTTGDQTVELQKMAAWVREKADSSPGFAFEMISNKHPDFVLVAAKYYAPNFQAGNCPYTTQGEGGFQLAEDGSPTVQRTESMRVSIVVPKKPLLVDGKMVVAQYAHGTGGNWLSVVQEGGLNVGTQLAKAGIAVVSLDQPMHGSRCAPVTLTTDALSIDTFNFFNIVAGLSGFRQSALDTVFLTRLLREGKLDVPAGVTPDGKPAAFMTDHIGFIGHSQGGLSGALAAAVEPNVRAFVLSGAGAGLSLTIVERVDPVDFPQMLTGLLSLDDGELSEFHPAVSLVQAMADITDPLAYAHLTWQRPTGVRPPDVMLTAGLHDQDTPHLTAEALAASLGLDILAPAVHLDEALQLGKSQLVNGPVQANRNANGFDVTAIVTQWGGDNDDHFIIFDQPKLAAMYTHFLLTALTTDAGEVPLP
jgi:hypothetical protein